MLSWFYSWGLRQNELCERKPSVTFQWHLFLQFRSPAHSGKSGHPLGNGGSVQLLASAPYCSASKVRLLGAAPTLVQATLPGVHFSVEALRIAQPRRLTHP